MSHTDLDAAAAAARRLVSMAAATRDLPAAGANDSTIKRLYAELNRFFPAVQKDIKAVVTELRRLRNSPVHLGDITASTAHEVAKEMVFALNREQFGGPVPPQGHGRPHKLGRKHSPGGVAPAHRRDRLLGTGQIQWNA